MLQEFPTPCTPCSSRRRLPIAWIVVPYAVDEALATRPSRLFYGCFLVIEAQGGRCFRTPCLNCQRSRHTSVSGSAPSRGPAPSAEPFCTAVSVRQTVRFLWNTVRFWTAHPGAPRFHINIHWSFLEVIVPGTVGNDPDSFRKQIPDQGTWNIRPGIRLGT